jgi:tetraacyldisaccharide 4'-kinase
MLPTGNLRESRRGAKRANMIIVTKCPANLTLDEQNKIRRFLLRRTRGQSPNWRSNDKGKNQELYFSFIDYDEFVYSDDKTMKVDEIRNVDKLLLAGIAKPDSFFRYLQGEKDECLTYPDHYHFTEKDLLEIEDKAQNKLIITTEKDFVRLKDRLPKVQLFYLPIRSSFLSASDNFDKTILNYVGTSTRNR